jgi:hypothetical protein
MRGRTEIISSAFQQGVTGYFQPGEILIEEGKLFDTYISCGPGSPINRVGFPIGAEAIVDIFTPGNVVGLETILSVRASGSITAAGPVKFLTLDATALQRLMEDRAIALSFVSLLVEARRRGEELSAQIAPRSAGAHRRDAD